MIPMSELRGQLVGNLKELHLPTVRACFEEMALKAQQESLGYEHYLLEVAARECEVRRQKRIQKLLRESQLPLEKSLEEFDLNRLPRKVVNQVQTLRTGSFLARAENVLVFGNPGSGKTHLACALGQELVRNGHRVYFGHCNLLVQELLRAKQELKLSRWLKRLSKCAAVILDDIGYVQQSREEMEVLFTLLAERYERGSVIITSNLPFSKWEAIFKDPMTTAAAIDRLVHHCVIIELNIPSYRMEQAQRSQE
jgi:DNA replication protein DnaC